VDEQVAASTSAQVRHAQAAETLDMPVLGAGRDDHTLRTVERLDLGLEPERSLRHAHGQGRIEVVALTLEARVRPHSEMHEQ
jgi:hypothetical protein